VATTLATVTVVAENYPEWGWVRPVGYTATALLAISMVNTGIHWYSDYPLAIALGYSFGMIASHPGESDPGATDDAGFAVSPQISASGTGIRITYSF
jgi:hypothetical protein